MPDAPENSIWPSRIGEQSFLIKVWETLPDIVFVFDIRHLSLIYINHRVQEILGYSPDDLTGASASNVIPTLIHPDDLANLTPDLQRFVQSSTDESVEIELRVRHTNGEWRWLRQRLQVFSRDSAGAMESIIGVAEDVSHRKDDETERPDSK